MNSGLLGQSRLQNTSRHLSFLAVCAICVGILAKLQLDRYQSVRTLQQPEDYARHEKIEQSAARLLQNLPVSGYRNLIADWSFLQFVQYFGDTAARDVTGYTLSPVYFSTVVKNDPRFVDAYFYFSPATSLFAGRPDQTVALTSQGLKSLTPSTPNAYYVWLYQGVDQLLFLGGGPPAQTSFSTAANWAQQANTPESLRVATSASATARFLETNPVSKKAQINAWLMVLSNVKGNQQAERYVFNQLRRLGVRFSVSAVGTLEMTLPNH
jgi:hypothetical protein